MDPNGNAYTPTHLHTLRLAVLKKPKAQLTLPTGVGVANLSQNAVKHRRRRTTATVGHHNVFPTGGLERRTVRTCKNVLTHWGPGATGAPALLKGRATWVNVPGLGTPLKGFSNEV